VSATLSVAVLTTVRVSLEPFTKSCAPFGDSVNSAGIRADDCGTGILTTFCVAMLSANTAGEFGTAAMYRVRPSLDSTIPITPPRDSFNGNVVVTVSVAREISAISLCTAWPYTT
jgi:hypothetical protein